MYDLGNRLLEKVRTGDEPSTTTFTYDSNGNQLTQTTDGNTKTLTYDVFNHLVRVERQGMVAVYAYRADGLRQSKTVNGHTTTHVWDRGSIILELNGSGAVMNRFSRGAGHLIRSYHHGFYLFNARTDVVQRVDNDGTILHTYRYDAFGNQLNGDAVNTNPFRFAAEYYDFETGFIYLRARFYNPALGRFISEDPYWTIDNMQFGTNPRIMNASLESHTMMPNPWVIMQAGNLFVYCANNPVRFIDPSGNFLKLAVVGGIIGGIRALSNRQQSSTTTTTTRTTTTNPTTTTTTTTRTATTRSTTSGGSTASGTASAGSSNSAASAGSVVNNAAPNVSRSAGVQGQTQGQGSTSAGLTLDGNPVSQSSLRGVNSVTSNQGQQIDIRPSANHSTTTDVSLQGRANSSVDILNRNGDVVTRRWFDANGRQFRDVHFTNHGNSARHPEVPHIHGPFGVMN